VHSRHPFPLIGDAACHQQAGGGSSHGHRQHAKNWRRSRLWFRRSSRTDRQTDIIITILRIRSNNQCMMSSRPLRLHQDLHRVVGATPMLPPGDIRDAPTTRGNTGVARAMHVLPGLKSGVNNRWNAELNGHEGWVWVGKGPSPERKKLNFLLYWSVLVHFE